MAGSWRKLRLLDSLSLCTIRAIIIHHSSSLYEFTRRPEEVLFGGTLDGKG